MKMRILHKPAFALAYGLLWILLFQAGRVAFISYNHYLSPETSSGDLLHSLLYGLRMDTSMAAYLTLPVCLLLLASIVSKGFINKKIFSVYSAIILLPVSIMIICDLPAYEAWGYRLDVTPLRYLSTPGEAWASVSHLPVWLFFLSFIAAYSICLFLFHTLIRRLPETDSKAVVPGLSGMMLFTAAMIIPIRGGFQLAPLNQSSVYFCHDAFANQAALNVPWNFMRSLSFLLENKENPYLYLEADKAAAIRKELFASSDPTIQLLDKRIKNPNIILIVWESFTSKALGRKEAGVTVTPCMDKLISGSTYFSNMFASGDRTDKGIVAVLSGYPAQPTASIVKEPQKAGKLKTLPSLFSARGYDTRFFYGGETEFANMKAYLLGAGFAQMTDVNSFAKKDQNSKWGAHDNVVKDSIINTLSKIRSPFFINWLTLSSHEPFETPVPTVITGHDDKSRFLNSLHYSDSVINELITYCRTQSWWDSTLIIILADHGHRLPTARSKTEDFRIPMIWTGGAIKSKGTIIPGILSQTDLAATLLSQLNMDDPGFSWSRKAVCEGQRQWAYFSFNNGFGFVQPGRFFIYDNTGRQLTEQQGPIDRLMIEEGQALQQLTFADYLAK
jgi:hypothetical protein